MTIIGGAKWFWKPQFSEKSKYEVNCGADTPIFKDRTTNNLAKMETI